MPPPHTNQRLEKALNSATQHWLEFARPLLYGGGRSLPTIEVRCDLRGKAAGQAKQKNDGSFLIRFNAAIATLQPDAFIQQTVPHEVAHIIVWLLHGQGCRPHGPEWRSVMAFFDQPAQRCHNFQLPNLNRRRQQRWRYVCGCREHQLTTTRHRRIQRDQQQYLCRSCQEVLRYQPA